MSVSSIGRFEFQVAERRFNALELAALFATATATVWGTRTFFKGNPKLMTATAGAIAPFVLWGGWMVARSKGESKPPFNPDKPFEAGTDEERRQHFNKLHSSEEGKKQLLELMKKHYSERPTILSMIDDPDEGLIDFWIQNSEMSVLKSLDRFSPAMQLKLCNKLFSEIWSERPGYHFYLKTIAEKAPPAFFTDWTGGEEGCTEILELLKKEAISLDNLPEQSLRDLRTYIPGQISLARLNDSNGQTSNFVTAYWKKALELNLATLEEALDVERDPNRRPEMIYTFLGEISADELLDFIVNHQNDDEWQDVVEEASIYLFSDSRWKAVVDQIRPLPSALLLRIDTGAYLNTSRENEPKEAMISILFSARNSSGDRPNEAVALMLEAFDTRGVTKETMQALCNHLELTRTHPNYPAFLAKHGEAIDTFWHSHWFKQGEIEERVIKTPLPEDREQWWKGP